MPLIHFVFHGSTNAEKDVEVQNDTKSDVYKEIGKFFYEMSKDIPGTVSVDVEGFGQAEFKLGKRGSYVKDGIEYPSMFVTEKKNSIIGLEPSDYSPAYLTCINPESNNYKFYHLKPCSQGINATYGRIGTNRGEMFGARDLLEPYPDYMYWIKYYEKISKGYIDQTEIYLKKSKPQKRKAVQENAKGPSAELYDMLLKYAKHVVKEALIDDNITEKQVKEARKIYTELCKKVQLKAFNRWLLKLLVVSPRKIIGTGDFGVKSFLAESKNDFADIILREENLLIAMETVVNSNNSAEENSNDFKSFSIEVYEATKEQTDKITSKLSPQLRPHIKKVYRVIPRKQKTKFDAYLKKNHINNIKELWHGSKNENWLSIITNSLQLNPNAQITGKMFGHGIYFAPSSMKSWGYTSYHGSYWAGGHSDTAFMGVYAVAYGKPYHPDINVRGSWIDKSFIDSKKCNCLHAEAGKTGLLNDEIVFYDEDAVCLNYIVEFA